MDIDSTDHAILYLLQAESRADFTHDEIAERIDVSSSTVSNRLQRLREGGVLEKFDPVINYEAAGAPHHLLFVCTAPISERKSLCERVIEVENVVNTRELLTGTQNLHVEVVGMDAADVEAVTEELDALGLEIERSEMLRSEYSQPFDHFGAEAVDESE
ncbi:Lrp/AsnC family transcriptional regulator [Natrinema salifodinae]|uniref:DNA-binding transcriptional regulator, Lrp family n=1 Tax=Natrinema salifodinae TaxID=1202768 RepID=A0A1I0PII1_9EURY|nr:Lrp/AsnC family transcriptional regulator [Natrinema salifodinae]SEW14225.1 DNA-binding transcriptional regulator, Lrp family [Natrinema salifodinae]